MYGYFVSCNYEGTAYAGSQRQANTPCTIEALVQEALNKAFRYKVKLVFSSRTDAGVHALANVFRVILPKENFEENLDMARILYSANSLLPDDIALFDFRELKTNANPRFAAISRCYTYNFHSYKMPFCRYRSQFYPYSLRPELLKKMAAQCVGTKSFASFTKKHSNANNYNCNLLKANWSFAKNQFSLELEANRFLRGMVRSLVGTMLYIDRKGGSLADFQDILNKPILASAPIWAPAIGLTLMQVNYPEGLWYEQKT